MTFWIAAKTELDSYLSILWFDNIALGMEIDQAGNFIPFSLSPLTM
jgi:hypothetical protein